MQIKVNYVGQFKINKKLRKKIEIKILDNRTQGKKLTKKKPKVLHCSCEQ